MKHGKKPTVKQKKEIKALGLNPDNWFVVKDNSMEFVIMHRHTGKVRELNRKE